MDWTATWRKLDAALARVRPSRQPLQSDAAYHRCSASANGSAADAATRASVVQEAMSRFNYHRRDESHREIMDALTKLGCSVRDLSQVGDKGSDLDVGVAGRNFDVECKCGKESLSAEQAEFYSGWRGAPVVVLHDSLEAEAWVNSVRRALIRDAQL